MSEEGSGSQILVQVGAMLWEEGRGEERGLQESQSYSSFRLRPSLTISNDAAFGDDLSSSYLYSGLTKGYIVGGRM